MAMYLFPKWNHELQNMRPTQLLDQHFGMGLHPEDLVAPWAIPHVPHQHHHPHGPAYCRPWRLTRQDRQDSGSLIKIDKDKFMVNLDVQQFAPDEITVKTVDNIVFVEGKHEEKPDDHGFISRHFVRRYVLPEGHDINAVVTTLSSDGILTITAPKVDPTGSEAKVIPITHTGPLKVVKDCGGQQEKADEK